MNGAEFVQPLDSATSLESRIHTKYLSLPAPLPDVSAKTGYLEPPAWSLAGARGRRRPHETTAPQPTTNEATAPQHAVSTPTTPSTRPGTDQSRLRRHYGQRRGRMLQIISPSARTGFGVPSTGGGGTSTAFTVASGADSITVTSPISMPFTSATGSSLRRR